MHIYQMSELTPLHERPEPLHGQCQALDLGVKLVHLIISFHPAVGDEISLPSLGSAA